MIDVATCPLLDEFMRDALRGAAEDGVSDFRDAFYKLFAFCRAQTSQRAEALGALVSVMNEYFVTASEPFGTAASSMVEQMKQSVAGYDFLEQSEKSRFFDYAEN